MSTTSATQDRPAAAASGGSGTGNFLLGKVAQHFANSPVSFEIRTPDGVSHPFGPGAAEFRVLLNNAAGQRALTSIWSPICGASCNPCCSGR